MKLIEYNKSLEIINSKHITEMLKFLQVDDNVEKYQQLSNALSSYGIKTKIFKSTTNKDGGMIGGVYFMYKNGKYKRISNLTNFFELINTLLQSTEHKVKIETLIKSYFNISDLDDYIINYRKMAFAKMKEAFGE